MVHDPSAAGAEMRLLLHVKCRLWSVTRGTECVCLIVACEIRFTRNSRSGDVSTNLHESCGLGQKFYRTSHR